MGFIPDRTIISSMLGRFLLYLIAIIIVVSITDSSLFKDYGTQLWNGADDASDFKSNFD